MTVGAMIESNEIGIRIPEDLSVIGFDNIEFAKASNPKLSIVTQPTKRNRQKCSRTDIGQTGQSNPGDASERNEVKDQFCRRKIRTHVVCMTRCTISLSRKTETFRNVLEENMKTYLIGIDIGTSGCKIAVFNKAGEVLAAQSGTYPVYYPKPGWAEQNPEDWWNTNLPGTSGNVTKS